MTTLPSSAAAQAYLKRLTALTESLPSSEQLDLLTGIEEHLSSRRHSTVSARLSRSPWKPGQRRPAHRGGCGCSP